MDGAGFFNAGKKYLQNPLKLSSEKLESDVKKSKLTFSESNLREDEISFVDF